MATAVSDVEKWGGWLCNAFSPNNPRFLTLLSELAAKLGISLDDKCAAQHVKEKMPQLRDLQLQADSLLALTAEDLFSNVRTAEALQGKFNDLQEATFGEAAAFFQGIDALIGRPDLELMKAVKREHSSEVEFTADNYNITTSPRKEWALVFGDKAERTKVLGGDSLSGGTIKHGDQLIPMEDRLWMDLKAALDNAHELINQGRETLHKLTRAEFETIGLMEEEVGCLRLYTGPMYLHYNTLLRLRGSNSHEFDVSKNAIEWARLKARDGGKLPPLDERLFPPPHDNLIAKQAIIWSHLHTAHAKSSWEELQCETIENLNIEEVPEDAQQRGAKSKELFPSLVFEFTEQDLPTILDHKAVLWARQKFVDATPGRPWSFEFPSSAVGDFNTPEKLEQACKAIAVSRQIAIALSKFESRVWNVTCNINSFPLEPRLSEEYTTTIHLISSGMIKLARLQPSVKLYRGFGGKAHRMPATFDKLHPNYNTQGGVEFAFMSCSQSRDVALQYSRGGYLFELKTGITTRGADLSWLSFYPQEKEICMPPCTAIEVLAKSKVDDGVIVLDLIVVSNPAAVTINSALQQRQHVVLELGGIVAKTIAASKHAFLMDGYNVAQKEQNYAWFNNPVNFASCLQGMLDLSRAIETSSNRASELIRFAMRAKSPQVLAEMARGAVLNPFAPLNHGGQILLDECVSEGFEAGVKIIVNHYNSELLDVDCSLVELSERRLKDFKSITKRLASSCTELRLSCWDESAFNCSALLEDGLSAVTTLHFGHDLLRHFIGRAIGGRLKAIYLSLPISETLADELGDTLADSSKWQTLETITFGSTFTTVTRQLLRGVSLRRQLVHFSSQPLTSWLSAASLGNTLEVDASEMSGFASCLLGFNFQSLENLSVTGLSDNHLRYLLLGFFLQKHQLDTFDLRVHSTHLFALAQAKSVHFTAINFLADALQKMESEGTPFAALKQLKCSASQQDQHQFAQLLLLLAAPALTSLDISKNKLGTQGSRHIASPLARLTALTSLDISINDLGVQGAEQISGSLVLLTALTSLDLSRNKLGGEGMKHISTALASLTALTSLSIAGNSFGKDGTKWIATPLASLIGLTRLNLSDNSMGEEGAEIIATPLASLNALTSLNLAHNNFGEAVKHIAMQFASLSSLASLNLSWNKLGELGAKHVATNLSSLTALTSLGLGDNKVGDEGAKCIAVPLASLTGLTTFNFYGNKIGDEGMEHIAQPLATLTGLTSLNLSHNCMTDNGAIHMVKPLACLTGLTSLNISYNSLGDEGCKQIALSLATLKSLKSLSLGGNKIGEEGVKEMTASLIKTTTLTDLNLTRNNMGEEQDTQLIQMAAQNRDLNAGLSATNDNPAADFKPAFLSAVNNCLLCDDAAQCVFLELGARRITAETRLSFVANAPTTDMVEFALEHKAGQLLAELARHGMLQLCSSAPGHPSILDYCASGWPKGLETLNKYFMSSILNLDFNQTTTSAHKALVEIANRLIGSCVELSLRFDKTNQSSADAAHVLFQKLLMNEQIRSVSFATPLRVDMDDSFGAALASTATWPHLEKINFCHAFRVTTTLIKGVLARLSAFSPVSREMDSWLRAETNTLALTLTKPLGNVDLALLGTKLHEINALIIGRNCINGSQLDTVLQAHHLNGNRPLELAQLQLQGVQNIQCCIEFVGRCSRLQSITLTGGQWDESNSRELALKLAELEMLLDISISGSTFETGAADAFLSTLPPLANLKSLDVSGCPSLCQNANLFEKVLLNDTKQLTTLDLSNNKLGVEGAKAIASPLDKLVTLTSLNLSLNEFGGEGAKMFAPMLESLTCLTYLNLHGNAIGLEGAVAVSPSLAKLSGLSFLDLSWNNLCHGAFKHVATPLASLTALTVLKLNGNNFGVEEATEFATVLSALTKLTTLDLSINNLGDEGAKHIAAPLANLTSLTFLNLSVNKLGDKGTSHFCAPLTSLTALRELNFCGNNLGDKGANHISAPLVALTDLTSLDLSRNKLGDEGAKCVSLPLASMKSLLSFNANDNKIGEQGAKHIADSLATVISLTAIDLSKNSFGVEGANHIAKPLASMIHLTTLDLSSNKFSEGGAKHLSTTLAKTTQLTELNLSDNKFGAEGAKYIATPLGLMTSLTALNLSKNNFAGEGARRIAASLSSMTALAQLNLAGNKLGDEGAKHIVPALTLLTSLTSLNISDNQLGAEAAQLVATSLNSLVSLTHLNLASNKFGDEGTTTVQSAAAMLPNLFEFVALCNNINKVLKIGQGWFQHRETNQNLCQEEYNKLSQEEKAPFVEIKSATDLAVQTNYLQLKPGASFQL